MKVVSIVLFGLLLSSCSMLGSKESAMKDSMTRMTQYKGEVFYKGKMIGKVKENTIDLTSYNESKAALSSKKLWVEPKLTAFPETTVMKNSLMNSALDAVKATPVTAITQYLTINDNQGNMLMNVYLMMVPTSVNEKNQVLNEGWVAILDKNGTKTSLTKVKEDTSGALEYYYFDEKWPAIAEKSL